MFIVFILLLMLDFILGSRAARKNAVSFAYDSQEAEFVSLEDGVAFYQALLRDCKSAQQYIYMQFFLLRDDDVTQEIFQVLMERAHAGVDVRLLLDRIGGHRIHRSLRQQLRDNGISFRFANKPGFPYFFYKLHFRNHRKNTVIDGKIAYTGGFNMGREYVGKDPKFGFWRDTQLKVTGSFALCLKSLFLKDWNDSASRAKISPSHTAKHGGVIKLHGMEAGSYEAWLLHTLEQTTASICIGSPYYIPSKKLTAAIKRAVRRGVRIELILPAEVDHYLVNQVSLSYAAKLIKHGVNVYLYQNGFYHAKVIIADGQWCAVTSANLDMRSLRINKELLLIVRSNPLLTARLMESWKHDISNSRKASIAVLKARPWPARLTGSLGRSIKAFL